MIVRAVLVAVLFACAKPAKLRAGCLTDADCTAGFSCDAKSGHCHCKSDAACLKSEFCNPVGFCQKSVGCDSTADCPAGSLCDTTSRRCIDDVHCTKDIQCPLAQVCSEDGYVCVDGCRDRNDCSLGDVCRGIDADGGVNVGHCTAGPCDDSSICRFGDVCAPIDSSDPTSEKTCRHDSRGPFCETCTATPGTTSHCGDGANFCLIDRTVSYFSLYCGVDCLEGQACPSGFQCRPILILTHGLCGADSDCPARGDVCKTDADCPQARCDTTAHRCAGKCSFAEDSKHGFCTCVTDAECPQDVCGSTDGRCAITGKKCTVDGHECDRPILCVPKGDRRACFVGKNCAPEEGVTCADVRDAQSTLSPSP